MTADGRALRVALAMAPGIGPVTLRRLWSRFGAGFESALKSRPEQVAARLRLSRRATSGLVAALEPAALAEAAELIRRTEDHGGRAVLLGEPDFPQRLSAIRDAPVALFLIGRTEVLGLTPAIAVVGARRAADASRRLAGRLAGAAAAAGAAVISGMAAGIDSEAHRAALEQGGATAAVLAGGPERPFPPDLAELHQRLCAEGVVLSEQPAGIRTESHQLVRRNRWIAALADTLVVIEASAHSGSLHAAAAALEYGRGLLVADFEGDPERYAGNARLLAEGARRLDPAADPAGLLEPMR